MKLIHDVPKNQGVQNVILRAYQITDCRWHARRPIPSSHSLFRLKDGTKLHADSFMRPLVPQKGMLYSAARKDDKFVGFSITPDTYMTALMNPNSVLYTRDLHGSKGAVGCYYGMVCSCLASYVTGKDLRIVCRDWPTWPGITEIDATETLDVLELCDLMDCTVAHDHIVIITDIARDENGHVQMVEVSESTTPFARRRQFDPVSFRKVWLEKNFRVYRVADLSHVTFTPSKYLPTRGEEFFLPEELPIMTNWGHNSSVLLGEENVEITVLHGDWDEILVTLPDGSTKTYAAPELRERKQTTYGTHGFAQRYSDPMAVDCPMVGSYSAVAKKGETVTEPICWHVHNIRLTADKELYKVGEPITLTWENAEDDDIFEYLVNFLPSNAVRTYGLMDGGKKGSITLEGIKKPGFHWGVVIAKNEICKYASNKVFFEVEV